ncbi:hypothetical protein ACJJTC_014654 [Scirpophaga incertulas]
MRGLLLCFSFVIFVIAEDDLYTLNILHYNDFHARFEETNLWGGVCDRNSEEPCIGGFARLTTAIKEARQREPQSILLNGGDSFQGTIWYNILRWNVTQDFMNMLQHDAHVLGNHEFDNGIEGVVPYLKKLDSDVVTANIIDDDEPTIQGLYKPSIIIERKDKKIGIIGVIISTTNELATTGKLRFTDEIEAVRLEAEKLNNEGVDIIIVLSHCGLEVDREIAMKGGPHIDIIVGGHSHSLLYNGEPINTAFRPQGTYPIEIQQESGTVLIVQAAAHSMYLGEIKLFFDESGKLVKWEGNPHYLGNDVEQDPEVLAKINKYLPLLEEAASSVVGGSMVHLSSDCACQECNLGSLICEAFMHSVIDRAEGDNWHYAHFCVINQGGVRTDITPGNVTFSELLVSTPFENNVEVFELKGTNIMEMLEYSVANIPFPGARMLQVSGLRTVFNGSAPVGSRVVSASVRCIDCPVPRYEPLHRDKYYRVVSQSFIGNGGDGFTMISENRRMVEILGIDSEIIRKYYQSRSPVFMDIDGRIQITNPCMT